jgi:hypothetical protein
MPLDPSAYTKLKTTDTKYINVDYADVAVLTVVVMITRGTLWDAVRYTVWLWRRVVQKARTYILEERDACIWQWRATLRRKAGRDKNDESGWRDWEEPQG